MSDASAKCPEFQGGEIPILSVDWGYGALKLTEKSIDSGLNAVIYGFN